MNDGQSLVDCPYRYGRFGCRRGLYGGRPSDGVCVLVCKRCAPPHDWSHPALAAARRTQSGQAIVDPVVRSRLRIWEQCPHRVTAQQRCGKRIGCGLFGPLTAETARDFREMVLDHQDTCPDDPPRWGPAGQA